MGHQAKSGTPMHTLRLAWDLLQEDGQTEMARTAFQVPAQPSDQFSLTY